MAILNPSQAAGIAAGVYNLRVRDIADVLDMAGANALGTAGLFGSQDAARFSGTSGALYRPLSGFGFMAMGVGPFAGDLLIATRGTDVMVDWVTDGNIGVERGPGGMAVHAGFNTTLKSYLPAVQEFLRGRNPTRIHCVGHSLGGALAKLNADFITANRIAEVRLYTFGAPRAGCDGFAKQLTQRVGAENIYRVSNPVDPVPMIPIFPFFHLPFGKEGLQIARTSGAPISFAGHKMKDSYIPGVAGKTWANLRIDVPDDREVKGWLEGKADGMNNYVMGAAKLMDMIGRALAYMLKMAGKVVGGTVGLAFAGGFTILDQVAWLLTKAAQISAEMSTGLAVLIGMIFRFLGRTAVQGTNITTAFLRWVLDLLFTTLRAAAHRALSFLG